MAQSTMLFAKKKAPPGRFPPPKAGPGQFRGARPPVKGRPVPTDMMADGGMGSPAPIGDTDEDEDQAAPPMPPGAAAGPDADMDNDVDVPAIRPESVNYHDDLHTCETCHYMQDSGNCSVLQMQVSPEGGCNAFEAKGEEQGGEGGEGELPGAPENDMGTSGYGQ